MVSSVSDTKMFHNLFGRGHRARGFRPRHDRGGIHFLFPLVVGVVSGELPRRVKEQVFSVHVTGPSVYYPCSLC